MKQKKSFPHVYDSIEIVENIHKHKHQKMPLISTIVMFVCFFGFFSVLLADEHHHPHSNDYCINRYMEKFSTNSVSYSPFNHAHCIIDG